MKEKNIFFIRIMPGFLLLLIVVMLCICRNRENGKPLACLAMTSADDSFVASVAQELEKQLKTCGNRVLVSFSDNDMNQQINQIENYVAMHPAVLVIQCTGDSSAYDKILERVHDDNIRDFAFKKKSPILPIIYETKRGIKIRNKNYSFFMYKQSKRTPFRV